MKTLIVYDAKGNIAFALDNATSNYKLQVVDVPVGKEISGVDAVNNKVLLRDSTVDKSELEKTNKKVDELQAQLQEAMATIDILVMGGSN